MKQRRWIKSRKKRIVCAIFAVICMLFLFGEFLHVLSYHETERIVDYSSGWMIAYHGEIYSNANLHDLKWKEPAQKGDKMVLTKQLNSELPPDACVRLLTYLSKVTVSYDNIPIYNYGREDEKAGRMVGSGYHYVRLQKYMQGRTLKIEIEATENNSFTNLDPIYIVPSGRTLPTYASAHTWAIFISFFLFTLGVVLIFICIFPVGDWSSRVRLVLIGAFSLLMGGWTMSSVKLLGLFSSNLSANTGFEYMTLYMAPVPLMVLISMMRRQERNWKYFILLHLTAFLTIFDVIAIVLHYGFGIHFCALLPYFHVLVAICLLTDIITGIQPISKMSGQERMMNIGLIVLFFCGMADLIRFNLQKYYFPNIHWMSESILPIGTMIFIVFLLIDYLRFLNDILVKEVERETLSNLAYKDPMTGLYNRSSILEIYEQSFPTDADMQLVLFDLNGLKKTNDAYGHIWGDLLIKSFAKVLQKSFSKIGACSRIGGDEFIVLIPGEHRQDMDNAFREFEELEKIMSRDVGMTICAAYGVAGCQEADVKSLDELYRLADVRMYVMKQRMKAEGISDFR